ncbi:MAG TPA: transglycosylase SLT domain-containing protein [Pseudoxanthomonas sp.]|nr:transglycosylase SLT domain-containing protein [Pseudoxanthomonas sp.]
MKRRMEFIGVRLVLAAFVLLAAVLILVLAALPAQAQSRVAIPEASALYRHRVEQAVADVWGVNASPARLAAQLHQESGWRPRATSPVGAQGVAQFMPATAKWIAQLFPDKLGRFDPWDAQQAILAAAIYDKWLLDRIQPIGWTRMSECTRWNFALRGYNGGELWLLRERGLTVAGRGDANDWRSVERFRARGTAAHKENINYPRRILILLEPAYIAAGWQGNAICS